MSSRWVGVRQAMPLHSLKPGSVGAWPCRVPNLTGFNTGLTYAADD